VPGQHFLNQIGLIALPTGLLKRPYRKGIQFIPRQPVVRVKGEACLALPDRGPGRYPSGLPSVRFRHPAHRRPSALGGIGATTKVRDRRIRLHAKAAPTSGRGHRARFWRKVEMLDQIGPIAPKTPYGPFTANMQAAIVTFGVTAAPLHRVADDAVVR